MKSPQALARHYVERHPEEAARLLRSESDDGVIQYVKSLPTETAALLLRCVSPERAALCLARLPDGTASALVEHTSPSIAAFWLRRLTPERSQMIVNGVSPAVGRKLAGALAAAENTAGAIMDAAPFTVFGDMAMGEVWPLARQGAERLGASIPVIDREHQFLGTLSLQSLLEARPKDRVDSRVDRFVGTVSPHAHVRTLTKHPLWQHYRELHVIDEAGAFLGKIRQEQLPSDTEPGTAPGSGASAYATGRALGELFWIGWSAMLSAATTLADHNPPEKGVSNGTAR